MRLAPFEREVLALLVPPPLLAALGDASTLDADLEETGGAGYFLTVRSPTLPRERSVHHRPLVIGRSAGVTVSFVVFVEDGELTLECQTLDGELPAGFRAATVAVSTAPDAGRCR